MAFVRRARARGTPQKIVVGELGWRQRIDRIDTALRLKSPWPTIVKKSGFLKRLALAVESLLGQKRQFKVDHYRKLNFVAATAALV